MLVVSRIDPATKREYVEVFDNGADAGVTVTVQTSTPRRRGRRCSAGGTVLSSDVDGQADA